MPNPDGEILFRNATSDDIVLLYPQGMPYQIKAMVLEKDGTPVGIGGIVYRPEGNMIFLDEGDYEAHGITKRQAARAIIQGFRNIALKEPLSVFISRDTYKATSEALLKKLGFACTFKQDTTEIWTWAQH